MSDCLRGQGSKVRSSEESRQDYYLAAASDDLLAKNLIGYVFGIDEAEKALRKHRRAGYWTPEFPRLSNFTEISHLFGPLWDDGFIDVMFNDGVSWLMDTLACNQLLFPSTFDMELIEPVILDFLREGRGEGVDRRRSCVIL